MFSMMNSMDHFRPQGCNTTPCFISLGPHHSCPNRRGPSHLGNPRVYRPNFCEMPDFDFHQTGPMGFTVANVLQRVFERGYGNIFKDQEKRKEKSNAQENENVSQRKRKSDCPSDAETNDSKCQKEMDPPKPTFDDVMNHAMAAFNELTGVRGSDKWQERVDCRGFGSRNIKVKIDSRELLLKAFRKHDSENGSYTTSMRKCVPLPANIDTKKIKCKLSPGGFMLIEAPYLDNENDHSKKEDALDFVNDIVAAVLPGLEQMLRPMASNSEREEKEKSYKLNNASECDASKDSEESQMPKTKNTVQQDGTEEFNETPLSSISHEEEPERFETRHGKTEDGTHIISNPDCKVKKSDEPQSEFCVDGKNCTPHLDRNVSNASDNSFILLSQYDEEETATNDNDVMENASVEHFNVENETETESAHTEAENANQNQVLNYSSTETENTHHQDNEHESDKDKVLLRVEMPSYIPESMRVSFDTTKRQLSIFASNDQTRPGANSQSESIKTVTVGHDVDENGLQCHFRDGFLVVKAPIKPTTRTISINT